MAGERMTDEELNAIEGQCDGFGHVVLNHAAQRDVLSMLAELRDRRAADLTDEEREAIGWAREWIALHPPSATSSQPKMHTAIAVLDKLLSSGGGR